MVEARGTVSRRRVKVILREAVKGLGAAGAIVDVAPGYARNFLLPKGLVEEATEGNLARRAAERARVAARQKQDLDDARLVAERLKTQAVSVTAKAGESGRLFGSVTASDVAAAVGEQCGIEVDRRKVVLDEPLKTVGEHEVRLHLHPQVDVVMVVRVIAS